VLEPYQCPKAWLQETWPQVWRWDKRSGRIEPSSLRSLLLYATQKEYNPAAYEAMIGKHTTVAMPPNVPRNTPYILRSDSTDCSSRISREVEPLLPQTNRRPHPNTRQNWAAGASGADGRGRGPSAVAFVVRVLKVLLSLGLIVGASWIGYIAAAWLVIACKHTSAALASAAWGKIAIPGVAVDAWQSSRGSVSRLSVLCRSLVAWIRGML
jgi:hypothetical protein